VSALQKPDATNVAGLWTWNSLGRFVKRGEKGIFILAPMIGKKRKEEVATADADSKSDGDARLYGFRAVYVFDRLSRDLRPSLCALDGCRECHFREPPSIAANTSSLNSSGLRNAPSCRGSSYRHLLPINPGSERERRITSGLPSLGSNVIKAPQRASIFSRRPRPISVLEIHNIVTLV
jgi:hypothetical protein